MPARDQVPIAARIVVEHPVPGVWHSLQSKDGHPLDSKSSADGQPLAFDVALRIGPGPRYYGDQVRPEGPERRFIYIRVGQSAGQHGSPWQRRMKIDIADTDPALVDRAIAGGTLILTIDGTAPDGTPACATIRPVTKRVV